MSIRTRLQVVLATLLLAAGLATLPIQPAQAAPCDAPIVNPVACENTKPGNPESEWGITGSGSSAIQGFATDISVDQGQTVGFKVDTTASSFRLDIYRMGYYGGMGARKVTTVQPTSVRDQPNCLTNSTTGLIDCGNWSLSASWPVPSDAVSGIYFAKLVRTDGGSGASQIFFIVRDDDGGSDLLFQTSDTTWQAYNAYGGNSLYQGSPDGRAYKVSYNRPFTTRDNAPEDFVFNAEYPMVRFLESNGFNVSYSTGVDTDRRGAELLEHKVFMSVGHDEYWSGQQRANVEAARAAGVNLAFFSGNEIFWKTRWENSIDGSGTPYRTLVSYKETHANAVIDPQDPPTWTGTWRDPRFSPPADGGRPENALSGQIFMVNCCQQNMSVGAADGKMRFWRNTRVANLTGSQTTQIGTNVIGYEWDQDLDNGFRPAGLFRLSQTQGSGEILQDYGSTYAQGSATHSMTMYRAPSGALVFGAGTIQWPWALDGNHDRGSAAPDAAAQQATVNLFADMGAQPATLQSGLTAATRTTDTTAPTSTITSPANNSNAPVGQPLTVSGTATDSGGGRVGGIEVSTDDGTTWHRATGRESWSYTFTPTGDGTLKIRSRATDDSGNIETPSAGITVTAGTGPVTCPCTIWPNSATPSRTDADRDPVEVGVKFRSAQDGYITGIRFYKPVESTGTHVGTLWSRTGTKLASVTFSNETASGWQQATFSTPVPVTAGTTYVASYFAPSRYASDSRYFASTGITRGPLTALQDGVDGGNGVYRYSSTPSTFPTSTYQSENYWVDVVFETSATDTTKPTVASRVPTANATDVATSTKVSATFSEPVQQSTIQLEVRNPAGTLVAGSTAYDAATNTATFTPSAALSASTTYSVRVAGATDSSGNVMDPVTWSFTTAAPAGACPCTIWPSTATPAQTDSDRKAVELGVKFRTSEDGFITGIRYYKPSVATGTHVGSLWTRTGNKLASVTFSGETASGWQQAAFSSPVPVTAGTTYVASYYAPSRYVSDSRYFASSGVTRGPLTALQDGVDGGNGLYRYSSTPSTFPTNSFQSENYWVDVVFERNSNDTTKPTVTARTPAVGATGVPTGTTVTATFSEQVTAGSVSIELRDPSNNLVPATTTYDAPSSTVTLTPQSALATSTTYTARVSGATDAAGNVMDPVSWTFTTSSAANPCPCTIWPDSTLPTTASEADNSAVELGVRFRAAQSGYIKGIRFYKGPDNDGTHVGTLWTNSGTKLASITFSGETATGWQQALFSAPVPVTAGTTYVASYFAPNGGYAADSAYFATSGVSRGPLTALQDGVDGGNGVYRYGGQGNFPDQTYQSTNYWVDVVFDTNSADTSAPHVASRTPGSGATDVPVSTTVTAAFDEPVQAGTVQMELRNNTGAVVAATTSYDAVAQRATLTPSAPLDNLTTYTATVSGAKDAANNQMASDSWSFTTAAPPPPPDDQGPGGPIGVVTSSTSPSSRYLIEIMRAEGLNEFANIELGTLDASTLATYKTVVVGDLSLSAAQVTALTDWVDAGGNLVVMRPRSALDALTGLSQQTGSVTDGYLAVNSATEPGAGITTETMQFHGPASQYTLNGATEIARLYSNATTATPYPAVTLRSVGSNGGQVAAFAYDLARSVIDTRQGNPAWAGQDRDGLTPNRSNDQYFGGSVADWVNLNKVHIPQADEQQRLLANLVTVMSRDTMPMPRFWYFPNLNKAVVVATGDDHGNGGTSGRFDRYVSNSPTGCSVAQWQCYRFTSYVYPNTPLSNSAAASYTNQGFEVGLHPQNSCQNYASEADLLDTYATQLADWHEKYTSLTGPVTNRFHCIVWSDWSSQPEAERTNGIRLDTNYYYYPGSWVADRPGFMTGSGIPMRFTDPGGSVVDVYQAATQMTDESEQSYPFTPNTLLDRAQGPLGYYGAFTANVHTDDATTFEDTQLLASAQAHGVPVVSAKQLLTWLDGRNKSAFTGLTWNVNTLSFGISPAPGSTGLTAMLPVTGPQGRVLSTLSRDGNPVSFTTTTIKGQSYATFSAASGSYQAFYATASPLTVSAARTTVSGDGSADVAWNTNQPATSTVKLGTEPTLLTTEESLATTTDRHVVSVDGLDPRTTYYYRVVSKDAAGNVDYWPNRNKAPATFRTTKADTRAPTVTDVDVSALPDGTLEVTWTTPEPGDSVVKFGRERSDLRRFRLGDPSTTDHDVVVTGLEPNTTYWVQVRSTDAAGNTSRGARAIRFVTDPAGVAQQTSEDFRMGDTSGQAVVGTRGYGMVTLADSGTGTFVSSLLDAQQQVDWDRVFWRGASPGASTLAISVRTGSTSRPDSSWTSWQPVQGKGDQVDGSGRYVQYRVKLTAPGKALPKLFAIGVTHNGELPRMEGETG